MTKLSQPLRILLFLLLAVLVALPVVTYASLRCRSDPKVKLSNGINLDIGVTIDADQSQVINVNFVFHVPVGVSLAKREHTPGWSDIQETFSLIADQQPNQYYFEATVNTTVFATVAPYGNIRGSARDFFSAVGLSNQAVTVTMNR